MIKAVFLDIDNTLLDFQKCSNHALEYSFNKNGLTFDQQVYPTFTKVNDRLWHKVEQKEITKDYLHQIRFKCVLKELNKDQLTIESKGLLIEKDFCDKLFVTAIPVEGAKELVEYLSKKYIVCIASNSFYSQQLSRLTKAGIFQYVNHLFVSETIGVDKPDVEFFKRAFTYLPKLTPSQAVMVGDSINADILGGKNFGMQTIWFNKSKLPKNDMPDFTVYRLEEIKNIL